MMLGAKDMPRAAPKLAKKSFFSCSFGEIPTPAQDYEYNNGSGPQAPIMVNPLNIKSSITTPSTEPTKRKVKKKSTKTPKKKEDAAAATTSSTPKPPTPPAAPKAPP